MPHFIFPFTSCSTFGCFHFLASVNNTADEHSYASFCMDIFFSLGTKPTSGITKLHNNSIFNLLRNCQIVFNVPA